MLLIGLAHCPWHHANDAVMGDIIGAQQGQQGVHELALSVNCHVAVDHALEIPLETFDDDTLDGILTGEKLYSPGLERGKAPHGPLPVTVVWPGLSPWLARRLSPYGTITATWRMPRPWLTTYCLRAVGTHCSQDPAMSAALDEGHAWRVLQQWAIQPAAHQVLPGQGLQNHDTLRCFRASGPSCIPTEKQQ